MESLDHMLTEIHTAALDLASTYGLFHGMNDAFAAGRIASRRPSNAIGVIQNDLIYIMVFRVCALCEGSDRRDDANMSVVLKALDDVKYRDALIEKDKRWRTKMLPRGAAHKDAASNIQVLEERWDRLKGRAESLEKIRHLRNKKLGHVTVGFQRDNKAVLLELWTLVKEALSVAECIQLVFAQIDCRYQETIDSYHKDGHALIDALRA